MQIVWDDFKLIYTDFLENTIDEGALASIVGEYMP